MSARTSSCRPRVRPRPRPDPGGRRPAPISAAIACPLLLAACSGPPAVNVVGSYFPAWMICAMLGILAAIVLRQLVVVAGLEDRLLLPLITHAAVATAATLVIWLVWFGH